MEENIKKKTPIPLIICIILGFVVITCIITAVVIFVALGSGTKKLEKQLELGEKYLNDLDYDNAILAYQKALEIDPNSLETYKGIVNTLLEKGDIEEALRWADKGYDATKDPWFLEISKDYTESIETPPILVEDEDDSSEEDNNEAVDDKVVKQLKKLKRVNFFDADGKYHGCNEFDENGNQIKWDQGDGIVHSFEYDDKNFRVKQTTYYSELDSSSVWTFEPEYDFNGNLVKETNYYDGKIAGFVEYEYDNSTYYNSAKYYSEDGKLNDIIEYEYDTDGNIIQIIQYKDDGTFFRGLKREYDDFGNQIMEKELDSNLNISNGEKTINEYDSEGNLIKASSYDSEGKLTGWNEYEYYD